jgi:hypothetical protein
MANLLGFNEKREGQFAIQCEEWAFRISELLKSESIIERCDRWESSDGFACQFVDPIGDSNSSILEY